MIRAIGERCGVHPDGTRIAAETADRDLNLATGEKQLDP